MISKLSLSLTAALALSAAAPRVARADAVATSTDEARALAGNPHSVDYRNRPTGSRSPTNDEINATETGNPHSLEYRNRAIGGHAPTNDEINRAEAEKPRKGPENQIMRDHPAPQGKNRGGGR